MTLDDARKRIEERRVQAERRERVMVKAVAIVLGVQLRKHPGLTPGEHKLLKEAARYELDKMSPLLLDTMLLLAEERAEAMVRAARLAEAAVDRA